MDTRVVIHTSPLDLLRAVTGQPDADSVRTNHCLGFVFARWLGACSSLVSGPVKTADAQAKPDESAEVLVTAWEGDELRLIFTKLGCAQCELVSPVAPDQLANATLSLMPMLVHHLVGLAPFDTDPALLRSISGPRPLVDAFLAVWPCPRRKEPARTKIPASIRTARPSVDMPVGHSFHQIKDVERLPLSDLEGIGDLLRAFYSSLPRPPRFPPDGLLEHTKAMIRRGAFWVYRATSSANPETRASADPAVPVGLVQTGRPTLRTCAIRMVFVASSHRGAGIAQRMVSAVARAHLVDAPRLAFDLSPQGPPQGEATVEETTRYGGKDEVCLSVDPDNVAARRVYAKVGFIELQGDAWCDVELAGTEPEE